MRFLDDNKTKIAKSGALVPLTRLARSKDMRVQRNATGALLNMTHSGKDLYIFPRTTGVLNTF
jgi:vacuolar protein 8